jgi:hypothetical protein
MATIPSFVARHTAVGQKQIVKTKKFVWIPVGEGTVDVFSEYALTVNGKVDVIVYRGDLNIEMTLTDQNPTATAGSCRLRLNSHVDEQATYKTKGGKLTVYATLGGYKQNISLSRCDGGAQTECALSGKVSQMVHLDPLK